MTARGSLIFPAAVAEDQPGYPPRAIFLHWVTAFLVVTNFVLAIYAMRGHALPLIGPIQIHKGLGIVILLLTLWRIIERWARRQSYPTTPGVLGMLAGVMHWILYGLLLTMAMSGWAMVSASPLIKLFPIRIFDVLPWPEIGVFENLPSPQRETVHTQLEALHLYCAWLLGALIGLHAMAALIHHYLIKDNILLRMVRPTRPWRRE